jgi:hypothetical protein
MFLQAVFCRQGWFLFQAHTFPLRHSDISVVLGDFEFSPTPPSCRHLGDVVPSLTLPHSTQTALLRSAVLFSDVLCCAVLCCAVLCCAALLWPADGDYGWGLLLRTLADVLQHDRRPAVVDASLEMAFGLLGRFSQRWDAAAWRVFITRVVRHMLALPPGLSPPAPQAALDSLSAPQGLGLRQNPEGTSRLAVGSGTAFGSPVGSAVVSSAGGNSSAVGGVLQFAGSLGGGAGGAVPVGMSVSEQGALMTTLLQRMDRYYPLLCDQAAVIRAEYKVRGLGCLCIEVVCTEAGSTPCLQQEWHRPLGQSTSQTLDMTCDGSKNQRCQCPAALHYVYVIQSL